MRAIDLLVPVRPEPDETTSHSTKLSKNDSQVAGYVEGFTLRLVRYFSTAAQSWLNLQLSYDFKIAEAELKARIEREV
ncbi:MAG: hypothetical protein NUV63_08970 [Gallionella sp.]|nr:hypothetical protein [Gallionella sp.]